MGVARLLRGGFQRVREAGVGLDDVRLRVREPAQGFLELGLGRELGHFAQRRGQFLLRGDARALRRGDLGVGRLGGLDLGGARRAGLCLLR